MYIYTIIKKNDMKKIKRIIKAKLVKLNIKPVKVTVLQTGVVCEHFANGTIKII